MLFTTFRYERKKGFVENDKTQGSVLEQHGSKRRTRNYPLETFRMTFNS